MIVSDHFLAKPKRMVFVFDISHLLDKRDDSKLAIYAFNKILDYLYFQSKDYPLRFKVNSELELDLDTFYGKYYDILLKEIYEIVFPYISVIHHYCIGYRLIHDVDREMAIEFSMEIENGKKRNTSKYR